MKKIIFLSLTILPLIIFGQVDSIPKNKLSFGLTFSPDYCYRSLKVGPSFWFIDDLRNKSEIPKIGYTTGLNIAWNINKRFSFETGLLYSDKGYKTKKLVFVHGDKIDPRTGFVYPNNWDPPIKGSFIYHYIYLDIPLKFRYYIMTRKINFYYTAGISSNIHLIDKSTSIFEYNDGKTVKKTSLNSYGFSTVNLAFITGFGLDYDLTKNMYFIIEPIYRRSIISIISGSPIKGHLYSMGLNTGLYYKL